MPQKEILEVRKIAILGAGVMGAQIAAHLANAKVKTLLFDLPSNKEGQQGDLNEIAKGAIKRLAKLKPAPLAISGLAQSIQPANYEQHLDLLRDCDLIIEAIAERLDWKEALYQKVAPFINDHALFVTNTSGISINRLAEALPETMRSRFLGVHFFNPPRYMRLVEIIPGSATDKALLPKLETFLTTTLGKGVVYAKDTPNFIANRIGVFSMLATMHHAAAFDIDLEIADALTGPAIGRPKSATFRTADIVGLDTFNHVVQTMRENLETDPWHSFYNMPDWTMALIEKGALGQKSGCGIYKKEGKVIHVFDLKQNNYRPATGKVGPGVQQLLKIKDPRERFSALRHSELKGSELKEAKFLWACFRDLFHYASYHLESIADNVRDVDFAIRRGFGWQQGPFETWQAAGWQEIASWIEEEIQADKTMSNAPLPTWVKEVDFVYENGKAFSPKNKELKGRSDLPVYKRQLFPDPLIGELFNEGETIFENNSIRLWHQHDDIAIASFKTKMNTIDSDVLEGLCEGITYAEKNCQGLILWQRHGNDFSGGANLKLLMNSVEKEGVEVAGLLIDNFHKTAMRLRYSTIPTVAAVKGRALGGGCELAIHCDHAVVALETYIGLVEVGVGLLPAGGGTKEFALRGATYGKQQQNLEKLGSFYQNIAMGTVTTSAFDAVKKGFFRESDTFISHPAELLFVAKQQIKMMSESGYRPPLKITFPVAGKSGIAAMKALLVNYREGNFISDYDYYLGGLIATVICGGEVEEGSLVDEAWIMKLERDAFVELLQQEKTRERINYLLETRKPLRN